MTDIRSTLDARRHAAQFAFIDSGQDLRVGDVDALPWTLADLSAADLQRLPVVERFDGGLTAVVLRLHGTDHDWTLKRARPQALVRNPDGQTSFLNEVQRRSEFEQLKRQPGGEQRWQAIVDTRFASFRHGVILSPWIEGDTVRTWDERRLAQVMEVACALWLEGFFEWDLCSGNLIDDGRQVRLFDFGYTYRFDPRRQFNTAGDGTSEPLFHPAERFETRCLSGWLMALETSRGSDAALAVFRLQKQLALQAYERMRKGAIARGATAEVVDWLRGIEQRWSGGLNGDLWPLYLAEQWRSHVLDLDDDLRGQTCTPMTLQRASWLLETVRDHCDDLRRLQAFFGGDERLDRAALVARYTQRRQQAAGFQVDPSRAWGP